MRALVIQYDADAPAGVVSEWLAERRCSEEVYRVEGDGRTLNPRAYDLIVSLGSEAAAYDDAVPWVAGQAAMLREAVEADVPVLGICFGSQLLARALGGEAMRARRSEIGWVPIRSEAPALIAEGPWLEWHYDTFTVPPGAKLLADSPAGPQAYSIGRSLGVQFHPEVTLEIVGDWVTAGRDKLDRDGIDPDRLLAETRALDAENRSRTWRMLDTWVDQAGIA